MVDYILITHDNFKDCVVFDVIPCMVFIDTEGLQACRQRIQRCDRLFNIVCHDKHGTGVSVILGSNTDEVGSLFTRSR